MKKILFLIAGLITIPLVTILVLVGVFFVDPTVIINGPNIEWVLNRTHVFETWTWQKMEIRHGWKKWNDRHLSGEIRNLCLRYRKEASVYSCFSEISWDFDLRYQFGHGFSTETHSSFQIFSPQIEVALADTPEKEEESPPPDIYRWWSLFWSGIVPDMEVKLDSVAVMSHGKKTEFDIGITKLKDTLRASAKNFHLTADAKGFELAAPPAIELPEKIDAVGPYYFRNVRLKGSVTKKSIPLLLTGSLEEAAFHVKAHVNLPLQDDPASLAFRREFLATVSGDIRVPDFRQAYSRRAPAAFRELPAPLNVMNGTIIVNFALAKGAPGSVTFHSDTDIDLASAKEALDMTVSAEGELPVEKLKPDTIQIGLAFHEVKLELPKLSKKAPPPQFIPDRRFRKGPYRPPEKKVPETEVDVHLTALNRKSLHIVTNLLDEPLRLNFDLLIGNGKVKKGHITALPLRTEIFRRPIQLRSLVITFDEPKEPVIAAEIRFPLPEYKITLNLEGPVSQPRYAFRSEPPLPQNDIFAVLLFGRPLEDLSSDDKTSAQKTNQILSQGILSLSVLYFLAGSPVEYVGFDPESQNATAQIGLSNKTSLRVGGGREGMNGGGIRHSLGKGWFIDTTVQDTKQNTASSKRSDYGVLLERVIAY